MLHSGYNLNRCGEWGYESLLETLIDLKGNSHFVVGFNDGASDKS